MNWWRNRSIRFKASTGIGLILLPLLGGILFGITRYAQSELWKREVLAAENLNSIASTLVSDAMMAGRKDVVQETLINLGENVGGQFDSIAIYDDQSTLTSFASGFPGGRNVGKDNYEVDVSDPTCWVCHKLPVEERPLITVVSIEGQDVLRSVVPLYNESRCQGCHGTGSKVLGDSIVDLRLDRFNQVSQSVMLRLGGSIFAALFLLVFLFYQFSQRVIISPLKKLVTVSSAMAEGELDSKVELTSQDEIGQLGNSFNKMAAQVSDMVRNLEQRVNERTSELENSMQQLKRRSEQFEAIAQLARTITSIQDLDTLLPKVTQMVSQQFGFYHVGLFLLDESRQYAVLNAANSEGGQRMLARKHKLKAGAEGIVGYVTSTGNPRIALDTGTDAVYFDNPDLPDTRSEMALPLQVGSTIIGALDVQSTEPNAFTEDDVEVLAILADEISVAIENARLFEESQRVLAEAQAAFGEFTQAAWRKMAKSQTVIGYELSGTTLRALEEPLQNNGSSKSIPIMLRGQVIGRINIRLPESREWDPDELDITQIISERVSAAIENASLLEESRRRALKESIVSDITTKIGSSINLRNVLQTAVEELGRALPGSDIVIQFKDRDGSGGLRTQ